MARLYLSGAHKSSGKTLAAVGLCAAFRARGLTVQPFKKGPDYIDPMWLTAAAGRACFNLDFNTMNGPELEATFARGATSDLIIVEGTKGLHDGVALDGSDSNAALARRLDVPVLLVIDCQGMTRGIAALLRGFQDFDTSVQLRGVLLNSTAGSRHADKLRSAVETYTDLPVLGVLPRSPMLEIGERHLGLTPPGETQRLETRIGEIRRIVEQSVNLEDIHTVAKQVAPPAPLPAIADALHRPAEIKIGVFRDRAFGFYYADDLEHLERAGAGLVFIDALSQARLPQVDGLFIGGGFPETQLEALCDNHALRAEVKHAIDAGLPVYAECGGLMYLARSLAWRGNVAAMVGALPLDCVMLERPQGRGLVELEPTGQAPWNAAREQGVSIKAHEFHYSAVENLSPDLAFAYQVKRGHGIDGNRDGILHRNVVASYSHLRHTAQSPWTIGFVDFVASQRQQNRDVLQHG